MFYGYVQLFPVVQAVQVFCWALSRVVYVASDRFKVVFVLGCFGSS